MTIWWLSNISRAYHEREQLAKLAEKEDWLKNFSISIGDGNLKAEFDLECGPEVFELFLTYPVVFPDAPPLVKTRSGRRISGHQYGTSGELCLEHRPDNWQPDITGAMMIESAYRLLSGEQPQEGADIQEIIDGRAVSIGQATRTAVGRFVHSSEDWKALQCLEDNLIYTGIISDNMQDKKLSARIICIGQEESPIWESQSRFAEPIIKSPAYIIKNPRLTLSSSPNNESIASCIESAENKLFDKKNIEETGDFYLLVSDQDQWTLHWASFKTENPFVHTYKTLAESSSRQRLPEELNQFPEVKVGIVGCGSLGTKIAMQLVLSEIGSFLLIDDDVFFEGNIVRNELCVSDIGFHKARALRAKLLSVNPKLSIETRQIKLGGQESSESIVSAMVQLSTCDLIIDATADSSAFNIIAAVCKREKIPVVWGSVFAGGIGGIIGRALPDKDPEPLDARQQIRRWCDSQGVDAPNASADNTPYGAEGDGGQTEVATDADVSVIAAHTARLAIDTLSRPGRSAFPYSAYVVGLSSVWIFTAPFDTRPITYTNQREWSSDEEKATPEEFVEFFEGLLPAEAS